MSDSGSASVAFAMRVIVYQTHSAQSSAYSRILQELRRKVNYGNQAAGMELPSKWRNALPNPFQRDIIRMIAILFGPMLVGAVLIPLLMIIFSLLGYSY